MRTFPTSLKATLLEAKRRRHETHAPGQSQSAMGNEVPGNESVDIPRTQLRVSGPRWRFSETWADGRLDVGGREPTKREGRRTIRAALDQGRFKTLIGYGAGISGLGVSKEIGSVQAVRGRRLRATGSSLPPRWAWKWGRAGKGSTETATRGRFPWGDRTEVAAPGLLRTELHRNIPGPLGRTRSRDTSRKTPDGGCERFHGSGGRFRAIGVSNSRWKKQMERFPQGAPRHGAAATLQNLFRASPSKGRFFPYCRRKTNIAGRSATARCVSAGRGLLRGGCEQDTNLRGEMICGAGSIPRFSSTSPFTRSTLTAVGQPIKLAQDFYERGEP